MQIVQAIIRSLPPQSSARVQSVYNTLSARLGRAATATELSKALNLDRHSIDIDIKLHGAERHQNSSTGTFHDKQKFLHRKGFKRNGGVSNMKEKHAYTTFSVSTEKAFPSPRANQHHENRATAYNPQQNATMYHGVQQSGNFSERNNNMERNFLNKRHSGRNYFQQQTNMRQTNNGNPRFSRRDYNSKPAYTYLQNTQFRGPTNNKRHFQQKPNVEQNYCSLCGKRDHRASQGCKYMVTDSGAKVNVMPTHTLCGACPSHVSPRLNHPAMLCPYRIGGPFSQNISAN